jgi:hypothetical protein
MNNTQRFAYAKRKGGENTAECGTWVWVGMNPVRKPNNKTFITNNDCVAPVRQVEKTLCGGFLTG